MNQTIENRQLYNVVRRLFFLVLIGGVSENALGMVAREHINETGRERLHKAVMDEDVVLIRKLIGEGTKINIRNALGETPLHVAAHAGKLKSIECLVDLKAPLDEPDFIGLTALMRTDHDAIKKVLCHLGARQEIYLKPDDLPNLKRLLQKELTDELALQRARAAEAIRSKKEEALVRAREALLVEEERKKQRAEEEWFEGVEKKTREDAAKQARARKKREEARKRDFADFMANMLYREARERERLFSDKHLKIDDVALVSLLGDISAKASSPDCSITAIGFRSGKIVIYNKIAGVSIRVRTLEGHTDKINSLQFSNDAKRLVSSADDRTVKIWDVTSGLCLKTVVSKL